MREGREVKGSDRLGPIACLIWKAYTDDPCWRSLDPALLPSCFAILLLESASLQL